MTDLTLLDILPKPNLWDRFKWWRSGPPRSDLGVIGPEDTGTDDFNGHLMQKLEEEMEHHKPPRPRNALVKLGQHLTPVERQAIATARLLNIPIPIALHERDKRAGRYERQTFEVAE